MVRKMVVVPEPYEVKVTLMSNDILSHPKGWSILKRMGFKEEILETQRRLEEIYKREMEKGTYEDWLRKFGQGGGGNSSQA